jgi:hypothetical protein
MACQINAGRGGSTMRLTALVVTLFIFLTSVGGSGSAQPPITPRPTDALVPIPYTDFNGDRYGDLAIGAPGEDVDGQADAGIVHVVYGSSTGTVVLGNQIWRQGTAGVEGTVGAGDVFGSALAVGNFNGDRFSDLAVGVPGEDVANSADAGAVNVLYGSSSGLRAEGNQLWSRVPHGGIAIHPGDSFGRALAAGDFNRDGYADLAVGVPGHQLQGADNAGAVDILYGSASGLVAAGRQSWHQDSTDIGGEAEAGDTFGSALAAKDFDDDGFADLAIGVPGENLEGKSNAGAVNVLYGSAAGLTAARTQLWHQGRPGVKGAVERGDRFGSALTAGDFNRDGRSDLAVGVPGEEIVIHGPDEWAIGDGVSMSTGEASRYPGAGLVNLLYGTSSGLSPAHDQLWHFSKRDVKGRVDDHEHYGAALAAGNFDGDRYQDLAIGVPEAREPAPGTLSGGIVPGQVSVLFGSAQGITTRDQLWGLDWPGNPALNGDGYGAALAVGNFNGDNYADLAIGAPTRSLVSVLYGSPTGLSSGPYHVWTQTALSNSALPGDQFGFALAAR